MATVHRQKHVMEREAFKEEYSGCWRDIYSWKQYLKD